MAQDVVVVPAPEPQTSKSRKARTQKAQKKELKKARPMKTLPTERIAFPKQLDLLRAYAAASGPTGKVVSNADVAGIVKVMASTVSMANAFFADTGLLIRADGGYLPAPEVLSFYRAYEWNPESASQKLGPLIAGTWFAKALLPKLAFRSMEEGEVMQALAEEAAAGPDYERQLRICLDYMAGAGLVQREGTLVKPARTNGAAMAENGDRPTNVATLDAPAAKPAVATAFAQPTEGVVQFHVSVRVDMKEFAGWPSDRISSFFAGIAQVLAAKGMIEKGASV
jgi:hypothetical protein